MITAVNYSKQLVSIKAKEITDLLGDSKYVNLSEDEDILANYEAIRDATHFWNKRNFNKRTKSKQLMLELDDPGIQGMVKVSDRFGRIIGFNSARPKSQIFELGLRSEEYTKIADLLICIVKALKRQPRIDEAGYHNVYIASHPSYSKIISRLGAITQELLRSDFLLLAIVNHALRVSTKVPLHVPFIPDSDIELKFVGVNSLYRTFDWKRHGSAEAVDIKSLLISKVKTTSHVYYLKDGTAEKLDNGEWILTNDKKFPGTYLDPFKLFFRKTRGLMHFDFDTMGIRIVQEKRNKLVFNYNLTDAEKAWIKKNDPKNYNELLLYDYFWRHLTANIYYQLAKLDMIDELLCPLGILKISPNVRGDDQTDEIAFKDQSATSVVNEENHLTKGHIHLALRRPEQRASRIFGQDMGTYTAKKFADSTIIIDATSENCQPIKWKDFKDTYYAKDSRYYKIRIPAAYYTPTRAENFKTELDTQNLVDTLSYLKFIAYYNSKEIEDTKPLVFKTKNMKVHKHFPSVSNF